MPSTKFLLADLSYIYFFSCNVPLAQRICGAAANGIEVSLHSITDLFISFSASHAKRNIFQSLFGTSPPGNFLLHRQISWIYPLGVSNVDQWCVLVWSLQFFIPCKILWNLLCSRTLRVVFWFLMVHPKIGSQIPCFFSKDKLTWGFGSATPPPNVVKNGLSGRNLYFKCGNLRATLTMLFAIRLVRRRHGSRNSELPWRVPVLSPPSSFP